MNTTHQGIANILSATFDALHDIFERERESQFTISNSEKIRSRKPLFMDQTNCKECQSTNITLIEYHPLSPEYYDGASEIHCEDCSTRFGRWSGKKLAEGEIEKPYGRP